MRKPVIPDSVIIEWKDGITDELPVVALTDYGRADPSISYLPSILNANRDVFSNTAAFHFNAVHFRPRGYDARWSGVLINGLPVNSPSDGAVPWAYWSGLNDAMRNTQSINGLRAGEMDFGNAGSTTMIDMRAFKQRVQTQFGYSFSNRSYTHRVSFIHTTAMSKKGWVVSVSGSMQYAEEGNVPGTSVRGGSYYVGIDNKINEADVLSLVVFGSVSSNDRASPVLEECVALTGSAQYNASWGYQAGRKRNANTMRSNIPVCIATYDHRISNHESLTVSAGVMIGQKSTTALDWYNAADPRPDYYRYLPSYQKDSVMQDRLTGMYMEDPSLLQINWDRLYNVNRQSFERIQDADGIAGNTVGGLRSHYLLERRVTGIQRLAANCIYNSLPAKDISLAAGCSLQWQRCHFYKMAEDLLGGSYYVDWNQFAEGDASVIQNDLDHPNRIIRQGDRYGYNYESLTTMANAWLQLVMTKRKTDVFGAVQLGYTNFLRDGLVRTGLFPGNSLGRSVLHEFSEQAVKFGLTYKINGRKYLFLQAAFISKAPLFNDVFISPGTRDTEQEGAVTEKLITVEGGYILNAPATKLRVTGYASRFYDGMNVLNFYHDGYRNFVNYSLSGICRVHAGFEMGVEQKITSAVNLNLVAALGSYYYDGRPDLVVSIDNDDYVTERGKVYSKNYRVGGTPQQAYSAGLSYQSQKYFYLNFSINYFREQWLEFNPLRRTEAGVQSLTAGSGQWNNAIRQSVLPDQYSVDLSMGNSFRVRVGAKKRILLVYAGLSNLLNKSLVTGGYEQLRFDPADIAKFPPKFFYGNGLQFSFNLTLRL